MNEYTHMSDIIISVYIYVQTHVCVCAYIYPVVKPLPVDLSYLSGSISDHGSLIGCKLQRGENHFCSVNITAFAARPNPGMPRDTSHQKAILQQPILKIGGSYQNAALGQHPLGIQINGSCTLRGSPGNWRDRLPKHDRTRS